MSDINPNLATAIRTSVILLITWALVFLLDGKADLVEVERSRVDFPHAFGRDDRPFVALLFSRAEAGRRAQGRPGGQAERGDCHCPCGDFLGEKVKLQEAIGAALIVVGVVVMVVKL